MKAASAGQKRSEQYVVEQAQKIVDTVPEAEYQRIVAARREADFVVGDSSLGYADGGKEIWEDPQAVRERQKIEAAEKLQLRGSAASTAKGSTAAGKAREPSPERPKGNLLQSFAAGASGTTAAGVTAPAAPSRDAHQQKELDAMLQSMINDVESSDVTASTAAPAAEGQVGPKRKANGKANDKARASKRPAAAKKEAAGTPAPSVDVDAVGATTAAVKAEAAINVKLEPQESTPPSVAKAEPGEAVKKEASVKLESAHVKREQLQEWLTGDEDKGVKADSEAARGAPLIPEHDGGLWFFFIDAFEDERSSQPRVYLFGKVRSGPNSFQSCCLVVEQIERAVHLLLNVADPDDEAAVAAAASEAEAEFDELCREHCPGLKKLRAKLKNRNYAFEKAVPQGGGNLPFLKVVFDSAGQTPPLGMYGRTFSHMFGAQTSLLERVLITRRIVGPSWLRLEPGSWRQDAGRLSFSAVELRVTPMSISAPKKEEDRRRLSDLGMPIVSPPLRVLSLSMQTVQRSPQQPHEPVAITCSMHPNVSPDASDSEHQLRLGMKWWKGVTRMDSRPLPRDADKVLKQVLAEPHNTEAALLQAFLSKVQEFDPDVIAGHNAYGFDLDVLATRMHQLKVQSWQKLGRLRRAKERMPRVEGRQGLGFWVGNNITCGRLVCDLQLQARDLLPKLGSYDLANIARSELNLADLRVVEPEALSSHYESAQALKTLVDITSDQSVCIARLMHTLQILPLSKQLTNLAGNLWNMSLQNKRAERNEMLLCHEFHKKKFVVPDKETLLSKKRRLQLEGGAVAGGGVDEMDEQEQAPAAGGAPRRGKAAYSGGLVLEPKVGLYEDFVMLLDFNSLYPSIIQEFNVCFTTVDRPNEVEVGKVENETELLAKTTPPDGTMEEGVLPQVLRRLVESRKTVKTAIKSERDPKRLQMLEIRQKALKLTANSMYGCLGFQNSRFYAKPLAALITAKGREALQTTIDVVKQELQLDVVYGDTDSVFVNTRTGDYEQAMMVAQQIKRSVNKRYKRLEIEIDAVFGRLMLLKKKKYAALKVVDWEKKKFEREIKGLDVVRRDWCPLARGMGDEILTRVLSGEGKEEVVQWIHSFLTQKGKEMDDAAVPIEKYIITKGLTKDPKDYPDAKNQPHVQVALRMMQRGKVVRPGQEVAYVICEIEGLDAKANLADRARHPQELELDKALRIDVTWYKKQQVHPLVSRLLGPVEGTDPARTADCLGMDGSRFAQAAARAEGTEEGFVDAVGADVSAIFDRTARMKSFTSSLPGLHCLQCRKHMPWKELLQPQAGIEGADELFRCGECREPVNPRRAQNLLVMQLRKLLREHCEGWVRCAEGACIEKTRRLSNGQATVTERTLLRELEYVEFLTEAGTERSAFGKDPRLCGMAAVDMRRVSQSLLTCNGHNWVDCKEIFGAIFGQM